MKVIIAGCRDISLSVETMCQIVRASGFVVSEVVCGEARGIDTSGRKWAETWGIPVASFPADWQCFGKRAGMIRNRQMANHADALIAVWDGKSRGTANMIEEAKKRGLKTYVHRASRLSAGDGAP